MNPADLLKIVTHLASIVSAGKDIEGFVADLLAKKAVGADISKVLDDLGSLLALFPVPGLDPAVVTQVITGLKAVV